MMATMSDIVRVSSLDQKEQRQLKGIEVDKKFTDKASGKDMNRPQLSAALDYVRDGDVLGGSLAGSVGAGAAGDSI